MVYLLIIFMFSFLQANDLKQLNHSMNVALLKQQSSLINDELKESGFFQRYKIAPSAPIFSAVLPTLRKAQEFENARNSFKQTAISRDSFKPVPLRNLGVTCYINASLQALALMDRTAEHTAASDNSLIFNGIDSFDNSGLNRRFITNDSWLIKEYDAINKAVDKQCAMQCYAEKVKNTYFALPIMRGENEGRQQDAQEFFVRALDKKSFSLFYLNSLNKFTVESTAQCPACVASVTKKDTRTTLGVPINNQQQEKLSSLIIKALDREMIAQNCEACKKPNLNFKYSILRFINYPQFLTVQLIRFAYDKELQQNRKITTPVNIDSTLAIDYQLYDLQSIIVHNGSTLNSGHYKAYVKFYKQWFECNDSSITDVTSDINKVLKSSDLNSTPYICVYKHRQNKAASSSNKEVNTKEKLNEID